MSEPEAATTLNRLLDPLSRCLDDESARRVAEFRVDPSVQARVDALAERANEGLLTAEKRSEYEAFINGNLRSLFAEGLIVPARFRSG